MKLQESSIVHVEIELAQGSDFSVTLTQDAFARKLKPRPTSPQLRAARQKRCQLATKNRVSARLVNYVG